MKNRKPRIEQNERDMTTLAKNCQVNRRETPVSKSTEPPSHSGMRIPVSLPAESNGREAIHPYGGLLNNRIIRKSAGNSDHGAASL